MWEIYISLASLGIILTILPKIPSSHWTFRVADFGKIQINYFIIFTFIFGFGLYNHEFWWYVQALLLLLIAYHSFTLIKYTRFFPIKSIKTSGKNSSNLIKIISANIYQFNKEYNRFINLVHKHQPDLFLTMESNGDWENALKVLENEYPFHHKVTLENTYGMHFYSKIKIEKSTTYFFIADDIPSIEAHLQTEDGFEFVFFGIHPPPPSPTEEKTSKERDGDLLSVAKRVKDIEKPVLVIGDFNNVAWSKSSSLFRKLSHLIDPRVGRAFVSTFHANYSFLRFPIDLMFHSADIFIKELKTLEKFGSDHLPVFCEFFIDLENREQKDRIEKADSDEKSEAKQMIREGIKEEGERERVVTED